VVRPWWKGWNPRRFEFEFGSWKGMSWNGGDGVGCGGGGHPKLWSGIQNCKVKIKQTQQKIINDKYINN
jgi:hypothetical protein